MLSLEAVNAAIPLAERLDAKGFFLDAVPGSPLQRLMGASRIDARQAMAGSREDGYTVEASHYTTMAGFEDTFTQGRLHDDCQDELVQIAVNAARAHMNLVRNLVIPAITELSAAVNQRLKSTSVSSLLGMGVEVCPVPPMLQNPTLERMIQKYTGIPIVSPDLLMRLPDLSANEIIDLMLTGAKSIDDDIVVWATGLGDDWLQRAYGGLFQIKDRVFDSFLDAMQDRKYGLDYAFLAFFIARKVAESAIEGIAMSKRDLTALASEYRNQAAERIARGISDQDNAMTRGMMVLGLTDTQVRVNEGVYRQWIQAGGENEALLGMILSERPMYSVQDIDANKDALITKWNNFAAFRTAAENNARYSLVINLLQTEFRNSLEVQQAEEGGPDLNMRNREQVLALFEKELATVTKKDIDDLESLCTRLVCRARFPDTDAEDFIMQMVEIEKQYPGLRVEEHATLAMLDYVTTWVFSQTILRS